MFWWYEWKSIIFLSFFVPGVTRLSVEMEAGSETEGNDLRPLKCSYSGGTEHCSLDSWMTQINGSHEG